MFNRISTTINSIWLSGWIELSEEEMCVVNSINAKVDVLNKAIEEDRIYQKECRRREYLALKEEFGE